MPQKRTKEKLSFEEALQGLETIVELMENGDVPLSELVDKFEEGAQYLKTCQKRLNEAELKIEKLKESESKIILENEPHSAQID